MDINTTNLFHNIQTDPAILSKTPFNAIYYSALPENQEHVKITQETVNWVMNEAVPDNIILDANTWNEGEVKAKNSVTLKVGTYTTSLKATIGSYIPCVASGGRVGSSNKETVVELTSENVSDQDNVFDESQIILYPNPTNGTLTLIFPSDKAVEIEIVDLAGKNVHQSVSNSNPTFIDMSDYAIGIYFLRLKSGNKLVVKKVVVN